MKSEENKIEKGAALGVVFGIILGSVIDNIGLGISIGAGLGSLGSWIHKENSTKDKKE